LRDDDHTSAEQGEFGRILVADRILVGNHRRGRIHEIDFTVRRQITLSELTERCENHRCQRSNLFGFHRRRSDRLPLCFDLRLITLCLLGVRRTARSAPWSVSRQA
jgi:hypothetical protein